MREEMPHLDLIDTLDTIAFSPCLKYRFRILHWILNVPTSNMLVHSSVRLPGHYE
jgi:hypothetical protein